MEPRTGPPGGDCRAARAGPYNLCEGTMSLITIVVVLVVVGVLLWLINAYIPMQPTIKSILNAVVIIVVVIWLLQAFGVLGEVGNIRVGN
jgi:hypothetical protein